MGMTGSTLANGQVSVEETVRTCRRSVSLAGMDSGLRIQSSCWQFSPAGRDVKIDTGELPATLAKVESQFRGSGTPGSVPLPRLGRVGCAAARDEESALDRWEGGPVQWVKTAPTTE